MRVRGAVASESGRETRVAGWLAALERRHLSVLTFAELRRALTALSALYVERRGPGLERGQALASAGKRAAFAFFYGALHFDSVRTAVRGLQTAQPAPRVIVDLGCGTGVAGAAWAIESGGHSRIEGVDRSAWALAEARWNWARLGLAGQTLRQDIGTARWSDARSAIVLAYSVNEMTETARGSLLERLLTEARQGVRVLVLEPLARRVTPWWESWAEAFRRAGGREDLWRFAWQPPATLALLDRAAGLDHGRTGARSLWID